LQQQQQQRYLQQQQQQLAGGCGGGRVLVHCSQGVSRSTTIAIAYLMWKTGGSYDDVYQAVRALRGVTSPNVGFMCQLINWAVSQQLVLSRLSISSMISRSRKAAGCL
jgi:dual specificity MAP kinase phosphatase